MLIIIVYDCSVYTGMGQKKLMCSKRGSGQTVIPFSLAQTATNNGHWSGAYGRLHPRMFFPTLLTQLSPLKRNGKVFHPVQDRYITVRECARAQTFPDTFSLDGDREEAIKQVSNPKTFKFSRIACELSYMLQFM